MVPVDMAWWENLTPEEQLGSLSTQDLSALLAERVFGWKVWRSHLGSWLALETRSQSPNTPSIVLDYAGDSGYCWSMLKRRVLDEGHGFEISGRQESGYIFWWSPEAGKPAVSAGLHRTWPIAVVMTMLKGHTDNLQESCLSYL